VKTFALGRAGHVKHFLKADGARCADVQIRLFVKQDTQLAQFSGKKRMFGVSSG
jgi:hypothetical protein